MTTEVGENETVLDELSAKLGTLEALLDSLERNKRQKAAEEYNSGRDREISSEESDEEGICFTARNHVTYEPDSLESTPYESESEVSNTQISVELPDNSVLNLTPESMKEFEETPTDLSEEVDNFNNVNEILEPLEDCIDRHMQQRNSFESIPVLQEIKVSSPKIRFRDTPRENNERRKEKFSSKKISPIREESIENQNGNLDPDIVIIKDIQYIQDAEADKVKNIYSETVEKLKTIQKEQNFIDDRIDYNISNLWKWAKRDKEKRSQIRGEVQTALDLIESEKDQMDRLQNEMEVVRKEFEKQRAPSSWLYFTISILIIWLCYQGLECNCPFAYV